MTAAALRARHVGKWVAPVNCHECIALAQIAIKLLKWKCGWILFSLHVVSSQMTAVFATKNRLGRVRWGPTLWKISAVRFMKNDRTKYWIGKEVYLFQALVLNSMCMCWCTKHHRKAHATIQPYSFDLTLLNKWQMFAMFISEIYVIITAATFWFIAVGKQRLSFEISTFSSARRREIIIIFRWAQTMRTVAVK